MNVYTIQIPYDDFGLFVHEIVRLKHLEIFKECGLDEENIDDQGNEWCGYNSYNRYWLINCTSKQLTMILLKTSAVLLTSIINENV